MEKTKQVPNEILNAATAVLSPYFQELTPEVLLKALETFQRPLRIRNERFGGFRCGISVSLRG